MFRRFLLFKFAPEGKDLALLGMRLIVGISIFLKHGAEKLFTNGDVYARLVVNHHYVPWVGVGPSLFCATIADCLLTTLLVLGFATRWCGLLCFVNLFFAWSFAIHFAYFQHQPSMAVTATHGEMIVAYLASLLGLALMGGGKYSFDALLEKTRQLPKVLMHS